MRLTAVVPAAVLVLSAVACASSNRTKPEETTYAQANAPQLLGCAAYTPPTRPWLYSNRVPVVITVRADGNVLPGSGKYRVWHNRKVGEQTVAQAIQMAESCHFEPIPEQTETMIMVAFN